MYDEKKKDAGAADAKAAAPSGKPAKGVKTPIQRLRDVLALSRDVPDDTVINEAVRRLSE